MNRPAPLFSIARRRHMTWRVLLVSLGLASTLASAAADATTENPGTSIDTFFSRPDLRGAQLSPSGRWLALITQSKRIKRAFLAIVDVDDPTAKPSVIVHDDEFDVASFAWLSDDRLTFDIWKLGEIAEEQQRYFGRYVINRDGTGTKPIHGRRVLSRPSAGGNTVATQWANFTLTGELVRMYAKTYDIDGGNYRMLPIPEGRVVDLTFDTDAQPRVALTRREGNSELLWRDKGRDEWRSLGRFPAEEVPMTPLRVDGDQQLLVAARGDDGVNELHRFDPTRRTLGDTLLRAPGYDVPGDLVLEVPTGRLLGARYVTDAEATAWFDPRMKALQGVVDQRFPGHVNRLSCRRCGADAVVLVYSFSDQDPGSYWLYRSEDRSWRSIGKVRADIDPAAMAQLDLFRIKARDGLEIPVWVTTPRRPATDPRPAVVLVHGGPWIRGVKWQWNAETQYLASLGYVVLEPEFRGSTGYGFELFRRGWKQWGATMQDDLVDAVRWAADRRMIDASKVCIAGASYGGYATLMGLARHPDVYRCGIAWVAVTDPMMMFANTYENDLSREAQLYSLPILIGDPERDAALLKDASPIEHARNIRAPLLIAAGGRDGRAPLRHSTRMRDALTAAGRKPEFVVYEKEGHGWIQEETRIDFWTRATRLLERELR